MIGAIQATPKIRLPYPHVGQQRVRQQAARFNWLCAGRRWRKTTMCMGIAVEAAITGGEYIWGAPTFEQARIGFEETKRAAGTIARFNESRMLVAFPGGGLITFLGLENYDKRRGKTANGVVLDETQSIKRDAYYEVIRPMLLDTNGWLWGIGTSNGHDWFWIERQQARQRPDSRTWNAPTYGVAIEDGQLVRRPHPLENPEISYTEIEHLFLTLPRHVFRREIMSDDDAAPGGLIYDVWLDGYPERQDGNVTEEADYIPGGGEVYWSVDDGYVGRIDPQIGTYSGDSHPRVIGFYQMRPTGQLCRFDELYMVETVEEKQIEAALEKPYSDPYFAACDSSAAQLRGRLHSAGIPVYKATHRVEEGIKELRGWIAPDKNSFRRLLVHPRCKHFRAEMGMYRYDEDTQKPVKQFDHGPDEARYLIWTLRHERE